MLIGYARVSTQDQNLDMQIQALKNAGCGIIFSEKITGTVADRPEYLKMKEYARNGEDTVVVYKLDRLGRSLKHLIAEMQLFSDRKLGFKSLQENIDTTTPSGKLFFHIFAAIAEFEKDINVSPRDKILKIEGKKEHQSETKDMRFHRIESCYGSFERSLELPDNADEDNINAKFKNGVLEISISKREKDDSLVKQITINT